MLRTLLCIPSLNTVNEMFRILLRIPRLNKQLMKCSVRYILLRIPRLNIQLMKCFVLQYFTMHTKVE